MGGHWQCLPYANGVMSMSIFNALLRMVARGALILAILGAPIARFAVAAAPGSVHCCCGIHDADHACGCPDCPAGHHASRHSSSPDSHAHLRGCVGQGAPLAPPTSPRALISAIGISLVRSNIVVTTPAVMPALPTPYYVVEAPPPRRA